MQRLLATCLLLAIAIPCQAQNAKPNTLTPKEIADGWILLFDGETTFGWTLNAPFKKGQLKVTDNALDFSDFGECAIWTTTAFCAFDLRFEYLSDTGDTDIGVQTSTRNQRV